MNEKDKVEEDLKTKEKSIDQLKLELINLTTEFKKHQYDLNMQILENGKGEYADIDFEKLLITGEAYHSASIGPIKFTLKTLTKKETNFVDTQTKGYVKETQDKYLSGVQTDALAFILLEYNGNKTVISKANLDESFIKARASVEDLSTEVIDAIWGVYNKMTRYIRAYLEVNLKN